MPEPESPTPSPPIASRRRILKLSPRAWLAGLLGFSLFYFYSGGGPNQASRFDLDRALLEHGKVNIDPYHGNTIDKAFNKGHYYCDKAPGSSLAALPALAVAKVALRFVGIDPVSDPGLLAQMHVATVWVATLPALFMCLGIFAWSVRRGYSPKGAAFAALALGLTSPIWAYAGLFWGHVLAAFCLVYGAKSVMTLAEAPPAKGATRMAALAGLATGWAVVTEFPAAPAALVITVALVWRLRPWSRWFRQLAAFAAAAFAAALVLAAYNKAAFGSPFHLGYASVQGFDGMHSGLFGVTRPRAEALRGLLIGSRGLLFTSPLLVLGLIGHGISLARARQRWTAILSLIVIVYIILLNASYIYWNGGWTYGPRHLTIALPFLALGLAPLFDVIGHYLRPLVWAVLVAAAFMTVIVVSTDGMTPEDIAKPLPKHYWPIFREGRVALADGRTDSGGPATNFGLALGLPARRSLYPLLFGFVLGGTGLLISLRQPSGRPQPAETGDAPTEEEPGTVRETTDSRLARLKRRRR
ncbi:MAG: hypothetical protein WCG85_04500 [Polyangia bacterium]